VFSAVFRPERSVDTIAPALDRLQLFKIGHSWGGVTSPVMPFFGLRRDPGAPGRNLVRFNIGQEAPQDLLTDSRQAFAGLAD